MRADLADPAVLAIGQIGGLVERAVVSIIDLF
jgi:hypothetical protein